MQKRAFISFAVTICLASLAAVGAPTSQPAVPPKGIVILWGGGEAPKFLTSQFARKKGSAESRVVVSDKPTVFEPSTKVSPTDSEMASKVSTASAAWVNVPEVAPATRVLDRVLVDSHFLDKETPADLLANLSADPGLIGVGVSPGTGLIINGRLLEVSGTGDVAICLPASVSQPTLRPVKIERLRQGNKADLIALSRAAIARLGPKFPPDQVASPEVPSGTVMPCGGGDLPDDVWKKFIDSAGGVNAPIVIMPIAQPDPNEVNPKVLPILQRLGCTDLKVLNQHTHAEVQSPAFVDSVKRARGIWFVGGRQWKYVDAYEGTIAPKLFADVLARGGILAGSSAGAAMQAEYMLRGNPLGNKEVSAEGYERGFCFLSGTAIDIHVSQRDRLDQTVGLVHQFPQLLGLAFDEGSAGPVQGHVMTIMGLGHVAVIDGKKNTTLELKAGDQYDLQSRKKLN